MYDISVLGSTIQTGRTPQEAVDKAIEISKSDAFRGRLVRVHGVDGWGVIAEFRNGVEEEMMVL